MSRGASWGGSDIWIGCLLDASLERCSQHFPLGGGPKKDLGHSGEMMSQSWPRNTSGSPRLSWRRCVCGLGSLGISPQNAASTTQPQIKQQKMDGWNCLNLIPSLIYWPLNPKGEIHSNLNKTICQQNKFINLNLALPIIQILWQKILAIFFPTDTSQCWHHSPHKSNISSFQKLKLSPLALKNSHLDISGESGCCASLSPSQSPADQTYFRGKFLTTLECPVCLKSAKCM